MPTAGPRAGQRQQIAPDAATEIVDRQTGAKPFGLVSGHHFVRGLFESDAREKHLGRVRKLLPRPPPQLDLLQHQMNPHGRQRAAQPGGLLHQRVARPGGGRQVFGGDWADQPAIVVNFNGGVHVRFERFDRLCQDCRRCRSGNLRHATQST